MREGFRSRAADIQDMLRAPDTSFVLVSSADATHLADAEALARGVAERGVRVDVAVFNRSYERLTHADPLKIVDAAGELDSPTTIRLLFHDELHRHEREVMTSLLNRLHEVRAQAAASNRRALDSVERLTKLLPADALALIIARLDGDIRDLPGLHALGPYLATSRK